ncbi:MAG: hypothetical protein UU21_C0001G0096 [Candidatus Levybacteria bacterium GW2011_GWA2_40_8]|nr:MAG: hypothetical protein UU21_C0001G0096 [Candidatus Levybacteria bacterium GW2011_GWA2_40_8]
MTERFSEKQAEVLIASATNWILGQREFHRPTSRPFSQSERKALERFWGDEFLDKIRIKVGSIEVPPDFARFLSPGLIGITFVDTVLLTPLGIAMGKGVRFHEAVHVAQFDVLGVQRFVALYGRGLISGERYHQISLERQAFELQRRFLANLTRPFNALDEVRSNLATQLSTNN